jgi:hypothetical protein
MMEYRRVIVSGLGDDVINPVNALAAEGWVVLTVIGYSMREIEVYVLAREVAPARRPRAPKMETKG